MGPPPPAPLPDEIVEEILLRIPPSDPVTLARAAFAQKRWCGLVAGDGFRRKYRALHRAAPLLGFFFETWDNEGFSTSFVPASSFRPRPRTDRLRLHLEDGRHGRVLFRCSGELIGDEPEEFLVVWDPITGHRMDLPRPKGFFNEGQWKATVLCAASTPAGSCDHLDCHRGHFIVVLIGNSPRGILSCVYSSQDGAWSKIIFASHLRSYVSVECRAHVGNALYMMDSRNRIHKYDLGTQEFSEMEPPVMLSHDEFSESKQIQLTAMEDGKLGLAVLCQSTLHILSTDEEFGWGGTKIINLEKCGNYVSLTTTPSLVGFAGDIGLVFMKDGHNGILTVDIRSAQMKVVDKTPCISWVVPYINFCFCTLAIPAAMGVPSKDDKPRAVASRDVQSCIQQSSQTRQIAAAVRWGRRQSLVATPKMSDLAVDPLLHGLGCSSNSSAKPSLKTI